MHIANRLINFGVKYRKFPVDEKHSVVLWSSPNTKPQNYWRITQGIW